MRNANRTGAEKDSRNDMSHPLVRSPKGGGRACRARNRLQTYRAGPGLRVEMS